MDVVATKGGCRLAVDVKGYPGIVYARGARAGQPKCTAPNQARHWFAQALLTAVLVGGSGERVDVAVAFPAMPSEWALRAPRCPCFLVGESGEVEELLRS